MNRGAIIDIGSNSVRLIIYHINEHSNFEVIDEAKETIRLGSYLTKNNYLIDDGIEIAIDVLKRFKEEPIKCIFYIFSISLIVFFLGLILITHGESVKYYLFADRQDTFMDFFNSIYDTIGRRPYDMGVIYPPLCYMIYYAFSRFIPLDTIIEQKRLLKLQQGPMISLIIYFVITVFLFIILAKKIKKGKNSEKNLFIFIMLFSIPFLYTF